MDLKNFLVHHNCHCVLLVDDAPEMRLCMSGLLHRYFSQVLVAADGGAGQDLYLQHSVDLVLTDLLMPIMDGWQLAQAIWAKNPQAKIIFLTGVGADEMLADHAGRKIHYLSKPIQLAQLQSKICEVVADTSFN